MTRPALIVMAKSPRAGRVKTRLCPDVDAVEAARLAEASLIDTLRTVARTPSRPFLALDGPLGGWVPAGFTVLPQRGRGLDERIAAALADVGTPAVVIGSDTPQVTPTLLEECASRLVRTGTDAVLGLAVDGGWWALGIKDVHPEDALIGVPMSTPWTGIAQLDRLRKLGLRVAMLPVLRDVDTIADALAVAADAPGSRFAAALAEIATTNVFPPRATAQIR